MGRSDQYIFPEYLRVLRPLKKSSIAFLGFSGENLFTRELKSEVKHFYDLQLGNWHINSDWSLQQRYDLIVCTRCAYFSSKPDNFIDRCRSHLTDGGKAFVDWGLGDHWRFPLFKVGWERNGEREYAYADDNFLHSCMWREEFANNEQVQIFSRNVLGRFGYDSNDSLSKIVKEEVSSIVDYDCDTIDFKFMWPDSPQLYIMTSFGGHR